MRSELPIFLRSISSSADYCILNVSNTGPTNCAGKQLALTEMRTVIVALLTQFDFELSPVTGESLARDGNDFGSEVKVERWDGITEYEKDLKDAYVMMKGNLWVKIRSRAKDGESVL